MSALILLNVPMWFRDPLSARQLVSWFLGAASIGLAIEGFRLLRAIGRPAPIAARSANLSFENTTTLVTVGAYRFIRHPLYASLLALVWCAYLKNPFAIVGIVLTPIASGFLIATAVAEERENLASFGAAYTAYMKHTRRFVPFLF
jgi:protein-S-isoprenylcysteine O-methyltransferase Ste14